MRKGEREEEAYGGESGGEGKGERHGEVEEGNRGKKRRRGIGLLIITIIFVYLQNNTDDKTHLRTTDITVG